MTKNEFHNNTYNKSTLADCYQVHYSTFYRWVDSFIKDHPEVQPYFRVNSKVLSPKQLSLLVDYLGYPPCVTDDDTDENNA